MNIIHSFLLGILQGLTEFIPVSSTAHMLIVQKILNISSNITVTAFLVLVQIGPILAEDRGAHLTQAIDRAVKERSGERRHIRAYGLENLFRGEPDHRISLRIRSAVSTSSKWMVFAPTIW